MPVGEDFRRRVADVAFRESRRLCSACSLLVRRSTWDAVGGMDPSFHPAYYEDVDLCLGIHALGQQVLFEPRSRVRHHESVSSDSTYKSFLFRRNQRRIVEKWADELAFREPPVSLSHEELSRAVWRARGCPRRILIIDDRVPDAALGSGYRTDGRGRARSFVAWIRDQCVSNASASRRPRISSSAPALASSTRISRIISARPEISYDAVIISRPHNYNRCYTTVRELQPRAAVVYDCEALFWRRLERQAQLSSNAEEAAGPSIAGRRDAADRREIAVRADVMVTVLARGSADSFDGRKPLSDPLILPSEPHVRFTPTAVRGSARHGLSSPAGWRARLRRTPTACGGSSATCCRASPPCCRGSACASPAAACRRRFARSPARTSSSRAGRRPRGVLR